MYSSESELAQPDAGDELPPRLSARRRRAMQKRRSRSTLRFRRQSRSFALVHFAQHELFVAYLSKLPEAGL